MGGMGQVGQQLSTATGKLKYGDLRSSITLCDKVCQ
jgi:hypothetical protein